MSAAEVVLEGTDFPEPVTPGQSHAEMPYSWRFETYTRVQKLQIRSSSTNTGQEFYDSKLWLFLTSTDNYIGSNRKQYIRQISF